MEVFLTLLFMNLALLRSRVWAFGPDSLASRLELETSQKGSFLWPHFVKSKLQLTILINQLVVNVKKSMHVVDLPNAGAANHV